MIRGTKLNHSHKEQKDYLSVSCDYGQNVLASLLPSFGKKAFN